VFTVRVSYDDTRTLFFPITYVIQEGNVQYAYCTLTDSMSRVLHCRERGGGS